MDKVEQLEEANHVQTKEEFEGRQVFSADIRNVAQHLMQKHVPPSAVSDVLEITGKFYNKNVAQLPSRPTKYNIANEIGEVAFGSSMCAYASMPEAQMAQDGTKCRQIAFHASTARGIVDGDVKTISVSGPHLVES